MLIFSIQQWTFNFVTFFQSFPFTYLDCCSYNFILITRAHIPSVSSACNYVCEGLITYQLTIANFDIKLKVPFCTKTETSFVKSVYCTKRDTDMLTRVKISSRKSPNRLKSDISLRKFLYDWDFWELKKNWFPLEAIISRTFESFFMNSIGSIFTVQKIHHLLIMWQKDIFQPILYVRNVFSCIPKVPTALTYVSYTLQY